MFCVTAKCRHRWQGRLHSTVRCKWLQFHQMVSCSDRPQPVRKPGYVSPPDPREAARKEFSQQLIAALQDAQAGLAVRDASPKDAPSLKRSARRAYDAMQFDFPVMTLPFPRPRDRCCTLRAASHSPPLARRCLRQAMWRVTPSIAQLQAVMDADLGLDPDRDHCIAQDHNRLDGNDL